MNNENEDREGKVGNEMIELDISSQTRDGLDRLKDDLQIESDEEAIRIAMKPYL